MVHFIELFLEIYVVPFLRASLLDFSLSLILCIDVCSHSHHRLALDGRRPPPAN